jgi:NADH dehydrogenase
MPDSSAHRIVIVGGGFGGLNAALALHRAPALITLIDRRNFHLFQPLLYQVATGGLSPANIAAPLRSVLKRQRNTHVLLGDVIGFDVAGKHVLVGDDRIPYDSLIIATGAANFYFNHPEWEQHAHGLKTVEDATEIRRRVLLAFEYAEAAKDEATRKRCLTFVVIGAGPTGVEMAGAISDLARHTLRRDFRAINPAHARILLIEGAPHVLPTFVESLSLKAKQSLERMGVEVWNGAKVTDIQADHVQVALNGNSERIDTHTVIWAAGVRASSLGQKLADATGVALDRGGRVLVQPDLSVPGHPDIFVIGDLAACPSADGRFLPGLASVAMQQGEYVANLIRARLDKRPAPTAFHYRDLGVMATIGRAAAVVDLHFVRFAGWFAWLIWLFVHITLLIQFQNRLLVLTQWAWNYFTRNRAARLITGEDHRPIE